MPAACGKIQYFRELLDWATPSDAAREALGRGEPLERKLCDPPGRGFI